MKNTLRFFVPPEALRSDEVCLVDQGLAHQFSRVLRLGPGQRVLMLDGLGLACVVEIHALGRDVIQGRVVERSAATGEPPFLLTVCLPLIRPERFEWALQKCVELGAAQLLPVAFARSLPADRADSRRLERWRRIAREAAEQSCRGVLPTVAEPVAFDAACALASGADVALLLWEREAPRLAEVLPGLDASLRTCALLSGPEGGVEAQELTVARAHGIIPVSLGPRILRAETAPIAAAALIIAALEV